MKVDKKLIKFRYEQVTGSEETIQQRMDAAFDILFGEVMCFMGNGEVMSINDSIDSPYAIGSIS